MEMAARHPAAPETPKGAEFTVTKSDPSAELVEPDPQPLLYSREQARRLLGGVSSAMLKRLEAAGELTAVRLNKRSPVGQVFYRRAQVLALAQADEEPTTNG